MTQAAKAVDHRTTHVSCLYHQKALNISKQASVSYSPMLGGSEPLLYGIGISQGGDSNDFHPYHSLFGKD